MVSRWSTRARIVVDANRPGGLSAYTGAGGATYSSGSATIAGSAGDQFHYVPMMSERTPVSLELVSRFSTIAGSLLDGAVLPGRAKATRCLGSTRWHRDGELPVAADRARPGFELPK